jgi:hypothetical protein
VEVYLGKYRTRYQYWRIDDIEGGEKGSLFQKVPPKVIVVNLFWLGRDAKKALSTTKRKRV